MNSCYPNWLTNFDSKKWWEVRFFLWNQSISSFILMSGMNFWCPFIKGKDIIMWIHFYPNWKMIINSKNGRKSSFSRETKALIHLSQWEDWIFGAQSLKERRLLCESVLIPIERWTLTLKIGRKRSFSYETKVSISFIPMRRMDLWCLIIKRKEITMWISVYPNRKTNFNSKKWYKKKFFSWNLGIISFILMRRMNLWCQSLKERRLLHESVFIQIERQILILKMVEREVILMKPKHQYH